MELEEDVVVDVLAVPRKVGALQEITHELEYVAGASLQRLLPLLLLAVQRVLLPLYDFQSLALLLGQGGAGVKVDKDRVVDVGFGSHLLPGQMSLCHFDEDLHCLHGLFGGGGGLCLFEDGVVLDQGAGQQHWPFAVPVGKEAGGLERGWLFLGPGEEGVQAAAVVADCEG